MSYTQKPYKAKVEFSRNGSADVLVANFCIGGSGPFRRIRHFEVNITRTADGYGVDMDGAIGKNTTLDFPESYKSDLDLRDGIEELLTSGDLKKVLDRAFEERYFPYSRVVKFGDNVEVNYGRDLRRGIGGKVRGKKMKGPDRSG